MRAVLKTESKFKPIETIKRVKKNNTRQYSELMHIWINFNAKMYRIYILYGNLISELPKIDLQAEYSVCLLSLFLVLHPEREQWFSCGILAFVSKQKLHIVGIRDCHRFIVHDFFSINRSVLLNPMLLHYVHSSVPPHALTLVANVVEKCSNERQTLRSRDFFERFYIDVGFHSLCLCRADQNLLAALQRLFASKNTLKG